MENQCCDQDDVVLAERTYLTDLTKQRIVGMIVGVLQSLRIQGSHLSEKIGLQSFRIAFCLSSYLSEFNYWEGSNFSDFSGLLKTAIFDL